MSWRGWVDGALAAASLPVLGWTGYLASLALLSAENPVPEYGAPKTKFDVIVPAHDEERGIAATVESLHALDYPRDLFRVIVVADNCADATAARARAAGARVLERVDAEKRGKGYALDFAFARSLADGFADALVVVDADTTATPNLLRAFAARLEHGASAVQAEYGVANPRASWRTRLMHIGFTLFHDVRSRGRERLGLSTGLRGNGMAFAASVLREVPHEAYSIVEDVEYGIRLGLAGHRVHYAGEARVLGEMVAGEKASRSQRRRWEGGRGVLARKYAARLVAEGIRRKSGVVLDLAADLLVPPLTYVALAAVGGTVVTGAWIVLGRGSPWAIVPWATSVGLLGVYVVRGVWLAGVGLRGVVDLAWAPVYMAWKVGLAARAPKAQDTWVRTARAGEAPAP